MTPSGWGDDAQGRDSGHDEMQARVYRDWQSKIKFDGNIIKRPDRFDAEKTLVASWVTIEHPFVSAGKLIGFADVAVYFRPFDSEATRTGLPDWWFFLEVKPRIYSVGAVIRQCKATLINAGRCVDRRDHRYSNAEYFDVYAVVYDDDPKAALLEELYPQTISISRETAA